MIGILKDPKTASRGMCCTKLATNASPYRMMNNSKSGSTTSNRGFHGPSLKIK